jgi:hypothetical protein
VKTSVLKKQLLPIALVYFLFVLFLQLRNGWYQNFSDAVHYLWIADKYAEGDWQNAINTYWGPMISWLLLLLKPLIAEPFLRFRVLQLTLAFTALLLINTILRRKNTEGKYALLFTLIAVPLMVCFAWFYLTPDLLLLNAVLIAILFYTKERAMSWKQALMAALIGALLFYIKSIGLYLFLIVLIGRFLFEGGFRTLRFVFRSFFAVIFRSLVDKGFRPLKSFGHLLLTVFFLLLFCAPWFWLMSWKHGSFTLGTSSKHNFKMNAPRITPDIYGEVGNPYHLGTLTEPNPSNAFDACVEHAHQPYLSWEGMTKSEIVSYYSKIVLKNIKSARSMFFGLDIGSVFCILLLIAYVANRRMARFYFIQNSTLLLIFFANFILYLPFFFMDRYTWPGLISFYLLSIFALFYFPVLKKPFFIAIVAICFFALNAFTLYKEYQYGLPEKPITEAIWQTGQQLDMQRTVWLCDKNDKRLGLVKGLIYYNQGQYLGALFYTGNTQSTISEQLTKYKINTIVVLDSYPDSLLPDDHFEVRQVLKYPAISAFHIEKKKDRALDF